MTLKSSNLATSRFAATSFNVQAAAPFRLKTLPEWSEIKDNPTSESQHMNMDKPDPPNKERWPKYVLQAVKLPQRSDDIFLGVLPYTFGTSHRKLEATNSCIETSLKET